jgi:biopolymer transport protein ExbD
MAGMEINKGESPDKIEKGLKRPKRRVRIRVDMTPMVDIAFLLLIFYMVSTVFSRPTRMEISMPPKYDKEDPIPFPESKLLSIFVDKNDFFYYQLGKSMEFPEKVSFEELAGIISSKNRAVKGLAMLLKLDQNASYSSLVRIIDQIQCIERDINMEMDIARRGDPEFIAPDFSAGFILQNMSAYDEYLLQMANMERRTK